MALSDLLKRRTPAEKAAPILARLRLESLDANNRLEDARDHWASCVADEAEGYGGEAATEQAEAALHRAKQAADKAATALRAVEARQRTADESSARAEKEAEWQRAEKLAEDRAKVAAKLAKSAKAFAEDYLALNQATSNLYAGLPFKPDLDAAWLRLYQVEVAVRQMLLSHGVEWAFSWPWGKVNLPEFMPPFEATPDLVRRWRDSARGTKGEV